MKFMKKNKNGFAPTFIILAAVVVLAAIAAGVWFFYFRVSAIVSVDTDIFPSAGCGNKICEAGETSDNCELDCPDSSANYCVKTGNPCPTADNSCCDGYCDKEIGICTACPPIPSLPTACPADNVYSGQNDQNGCVVAYACAKSECTQKGNNCCLNYTDCGAPAHCDVDSAVNMKGCDSGCKPIFECVALMGCVKENEGMGLNSGRSCCAGLEKMTEYQESPPCYSGQCKPSPAIGYFCARSAKISQGKTQQDQAIKAATILIDGKATDISKLSISFPIDKVEAYSIAKDFCNKKEQDKGKNFYGNIGDLENKWFVNITVVNCICGVLIDKETGETVCFYTVGGDKISELKY